jgi:penicillin G amidase
VSRLGSWLARGAAAVLTARSRAALPPHAGRVRVRGMPGGARVTFDEAGVPHVEAATDHDALAALGVCHALDRWFQMDVMRRVLSGATSALLGERPLGDMGFPPFGAQRTTVDADRLMLALDVPASAARGLAHADDEGRSLLDAYVAGVNAGLEVLRTRRPLEHRLLGLSLEPWKPVDTLLVAKGMALGLSFKWRSVPVLSAVAERLAGKPEHLAALLPRSPGEACLAHARWFAGGVAGALPFLPGGPGAVGSNAVLVGGGLTRSGAPILAGDPHLELALPGVWYLASVKGARYAAVGCTIPGAPGVVIGRTPSVAWTLTNAMLDDADVWVEELDPTGTRHRVDGRWVELASRAHEIHRRGAAPVMFRLRATQRGPLLSDAFPGYEGPPLSLRATWMEPGRDLETFLGLGRCRRADEVPAAVSGYASPAQNLLYADRDGGGWRMLGRVPRRRPGPDPALARDGRTSEHDWLEPVPEDELPRLPLAREGLVVSANHPQVDGAYPHYLSHLYEPEHRARRLHALLDGRRGLVADDLASVQRDAVDLSAGAFRARVVLPLADAVRRQRPAAAGLVDRLLAHDAGAEADHRGTLLHHLTYHHLARRTFGPLLGDTLALRWMGLMNLLDEPLLRAFSDPASPWAPPASRPVLLADALEAAARDAAARGLALDAPWGAAHRLTLHHPAGTLGLLKPAFDRGPFPMPGGPYSVCSGQYRHDRPLDVTVGASYRQVVDLADPAAGRMITFGGQSGAIGSPHYDDLTPRWLAGEWLPMRLEDLPARGDVLLLEPA